MAEPWVTALHSLNEREVLIWCVTRRHRTEAQRFGYVHRACDIVFAQIRDGARDTQHPMKRARREPDSLGGGREQLARIGLDWRGRLQPPTWRTAIRLRPAERRVAVPLTRAGALDAQPDGGGALALLRRSELTHRN